MALSAGTVTANSDGTFSGSGMALDMANAVGPSLYTLAQNQLNAAGPFDASVPTTLSSNAKYQIAQTVAAWAQGMATAIVNNIQTHAVARITTSTSTGRIPASITTGTAIDPPSAEVDLQIQ